jgi:hypothetical protein
MLKGKNLLFLLIAAGVAYYYLVWENSAKDKENDAKKAKTNS